MKIKLLTREDAFELVNKSKDGIVVIPNGITDIDYNAFVGSSMISVIIPNSVVSIGNNAFMYCTSLKSITIPNSVKVIGDCAFKHCISLSSITLPNSIKRIKCWTFYNCSSLKKIVIPNSVEIIEGYAFGNCNLLKSITIPNSVKSIGFDVFDSCISLKRVIFEGTIKHVSYNIFNECDKLYKNTTKKYDDKGRLIAYKGFELDCGLLTCRDFVYEEGETYKMDGKIELCERGFHACLNKLECFNYYSGEIGEAVEYHEVYLNGVSDETETWSTKVVASEITIGPKIENFSVR